ncbi:MAG: hypothetical protein J6C96_05990, partial [Oscillospiraceae bacterium]|nr:hypothetical protein [Oscillospiraceae bacterium]
YKNYAPFKTVHRTVLKKSFICSCNKGRRSCSPPLKMLSHFSPLAPFCRAPAGASRRFAVCGRRPKGFQPSGHLTSAAALDQLLSLRWVLKFVLHHAIVIEQQMNSVAQK